MLTLGNSLTLGTPAHGGEPLILPASARATHLYTCGATGTGKSKFLQHLIQEDIKAWSKSNCGLIVIDPHGSLYDDLMAWLAWHPVLHNRPVIPIDLRRDDWVISYNPLKQRPAADPAVLVSQFVQAMAYVWGQSGTDETPLFERWGSTILSTLYDKRLTLLEAEHLLDGVMKQQRQSMTGNLKSRSAARNWRLADTLSPKDFESHIGSTVNRLHRFLETEALRLAFGQGGASLDLAAAIEEGHIILVSLATRGNRVSEEDAALFATLLLTDLWTAARQRPKGGGRSAPKPFYVYLDEFQNFVTPTIAKNLDQARGFGLHLTLAHQFPNQLLHTGARGKQVYDSVFVNARSKVVFGMEGEENLKPLAQSLFMGTMDPDKIKHEIYSTKVMRYVEEYRTAYSRSTGSGSGGTHQSGGASGSGSGGTTELPRAFGQRGARSRSESEFASTSESRSDSWSQSHSYGQSDSSMLIPVMDKELSSREYESLEEQLFRAMAVLHGQDQRQCVARLVGSRLPVSLYTPDMPASYATTEFVEDYIGTLFEKWPFALRTVDARRELAEREARFTEDAVRSLVDEPKTSKRRLK